MLASRVNAGMGRRGESPWTLGILGCIGYLFVITSYRIPTAIPFIGLALASIALRLHTLRVSGAQVTLLLFGAWAGMSALGSTYPQEAMAGLLLFAKAAVIALMIAWSIRTRAQLLLLLSVYLFCFLAFPVRGTLFSYYLYRAGVFSGFGSMRAAWNFAFANPNDLAAYCLLVSGLAVSLALLSRRPWVRRAAVGATALLILLIILTQSRSGLLGLATTVAAAVWTLRLYRRRAFWWVSAAGLGLLLSLTPRAALERYVGLRKLTTLSTVQAADPEGSADQRLEIMRVALSIAQDAPVFGVGIGAYNRAHGEYAGRFGIRGIAIGQRDAHSTYLRLLAETGLVGLGLFVLVVALTVRETLRIRHSFPPGSAEYIALTAVNLTWLGFAVCALFGSLAMASVTYVQLGLVWGASRVLQRPLPRPGDRTPRAAPGPSRGPWPRRQGPGRDLRHVPVP